MYTAENIETSNTTNATFSNVANTTTTTVNAPAAVAATVALAADSTVDQYGAQTRANNCISFLTVRHVESTLDERLRSWWSRTFAITEGASSSKESIAPELAGPVGRNRENTPPGIFNALG